MLVGAVSDEPVFRILRSHRSPHRTSWRTSFTTPPIG